MPPTALLAQSDRIRPASTRLAAAARDRGTGDVSVIGFDGVPEGATCALPLTTIRQPIVEMGPRAVQILVAHAPEVRRERLAVELVVRLDRVAPALV